MCCPVDVCAKHWLLELNSSPALGSLELLTGSFAEVVPVQCDCTSLQHRGFALWGHHGLMAGPCAVFRAGHHGPAQSTALPAQGLLDRGALFCCAHSHYADSATVLLRRWWHSVISDYWYLTYFYGLVVREPHRVRCTSMVCLLSLVCDARAFQKVFVTVFCDHCWWPQPCSVPPSAGEKCLAATIACYLQRALQHA